MIEWIEKFQTGLAYLGLTVPMLFVLLFGVTLMMVLLLMYYVMQRNPKSTFDFSQMFENEKTQRTSGTKFIAINASFVSYFVIVFLLVADRLTTEMFTIWLGIMIVGKVGSELVATRTALQSDIPTLTERARAPDPRKEKT